MAQGGRSSCSRRTTGVWGRVVRRSAGANLLNLTFVDKSVPVDSKALDDMPYFLNQWLMGHIAKFDLKLRDWVAK